MRNNNETEINLCPSTSSASEIQIDTLSTIAKKVKYKRLEYENKDVERKQITSMQRLKTLILSFIEIERKTEIVLGNEER